MNKARFFSH